MSRILSTDGGGDIPACTGQAPPGRHPPGQTPPGQTPPQADTPGQTPTPTATAADGTHPTGMHSCLYNVTAEGERGERTQASETSIGSLQVPMGTKRFRHNDHEYWQGTDLISFKNYISLINGFSLFPFSPE